MAVSFEKSVRRVVPRWHSLRHAIATRELDPVEMSGAAKAEPNLFLAKKEEEWLANPQIFSALDLVNAAVVLGITPNAQEAARFILSRNEVVSTMALDIAATVLGRVKAPPELQERLSRAELQVKVRAQKERRKTEPRNAFVWSELSRLYVLLGMPDQARRPMEIALNLAPSDRFVVRSATRFLLHAGDPEEALSLLRRCSSTPYDPWLLAAEVAVSSVLTKTPRFVKEGEKIVGSNSLQPLHTSELSAALASLEMWSGNSKGAKRLFLKTLEAPSENALAQVVFAAESLSLPDLSVRTSRTANAFEAQALDADNKGNWEMAVKQCANWADIESFSSRPYSMSSCIASSLLGRHDDAIEIASGGLRTNPKHAGLRNNIAFALVENGKPNEALAEIEKVDLESASLSSKICLIATAGLIEYRRGNATEGRELYEKAISFAGRNSQPKLKATAQIYLAREEARIGHPDYGPIFDTGSKQLNLGNYAFGKALASVVEKQIKEFVSNKAQAG